MQQSTSHPRPPKPSPAAPPREPLSWLDALRAQCNDVIAAGLDATDRPSRRVLGRREARRQIQEAGRAIGALLDAAGQRGGAP